MFKRSLRHAESVLEDEARFAQRRRIRNYALLLALGLLVLLLLVTLVQATFGGQGDVQRDTDILEPQLLVFLTSNDVYKLVGRPNELKSYVWRSGELTEVGVLTAFERFIESCRGPLDENCFPIHAFGFPDKDEGLPGFAEPSLVEATWPPVGSGCTDASEFREHLAKDERTLYGGLASYGASIRGVTEALRSRGAEVVNLHAGDFLSPSYAAKKYKGDQFIQMMNHAGIDVVAPGNHDFDFGAERLTEQMVMSSFVWLLANVREESGQLLGSSLHGGEPVRTAPTAECEGSGVSTWLGCSYPPSHWLKERSELSSTLYPYARDVVVRQKFGKQICIFGTTGADDANVELEMRSPSVEAGDDIEEGLRILRDIRAKKYGDCALVVAITHARTGRDLKFYHRAVTEGLHMDAIIGGHDHYQVYMELTYRGRRTHLVKTGSDGHILGQLTFDLSTDEPSSRLEWVPVVNEGCEQMCKRMAGLDRWAGCSEWMSWANHLAGKYAKEVREAQQVPLPIGFSGIYDTANVRMKETRAANLWADVVRVGTGADVLTLFGGGMRQEAYVSLPPQSHLTKLDILEEFPFDGASIYVVDIPVGALLRWVENIVEVHCGTAVSPMKMHISGIEVTYGENSAKDSGCSLVQVRYFGNGHQEGSKKKVVLPDEGLAYGSVLYEAGKVRNAHHVIRFGAAAYPLVNDPQPGAVQLLTARVVADQQKRCAEMPGGANCTEGKPSQGFYKLINENQKALEDQAGYDTDTPLYEWSVDTPPLRLLEMRDQMGILNKAIDEGAKGWAVDLAREQDCDFWTKERQLDPHEVIPSRGLKDNLPVFRFWDVRWRTDVNISQDIVDEDDMGQVHQSPEDPAAISAEKPSSCAHVRGRGMGKAVVERLWKPHFEQAARHLGAPTQNALGLSAHRQW